MIVLNSEQTIKCVPLSKAIEAIEEVMVKYNNRETITPHRHVLQTPFGGPTLFMPSILSQESETEANIGIKIVSVRPNEAITVPAVVLLLDAKSGMPKLMFNGTECTAIRTASCSAVATKYLARKDASVLGVFGAGLQAKFHILTCCLVSQNIDTVYIWNRTESRAQVLMQELLELDMYLPFVFAAKGCAASDHVPNGRVIRVQVMSDGDRVAMLSHIICTCTNSKTPVFDGKMVQPGTHINCIGSYRKDMQEVDSYIVSKSRMVADDAKSVWEESGDVNTPLNEGHISHDHILLDNMGQLSEETAKLVRRDEVNDITMFKCVGMAAQDVAIAKVVWETVSSASDTISMQTVDIL